MSAGTSARVCARKCIGYTTPLALREDAPLALRLEEAEGLGRGSATTIECERVALSPASS